MNQDDLDRVTLRWSKAKSALERMQKFRERGDHINPARARAIQNEFDEAAIQRANVRMALHGSAA